MTEMALLFLNILVPKMFTFVATFKGFAGVSWYLLYLYDDRGTVDCECFVVVVGFYASHPEWPQGHK